MTSRLREFQELAQNNGGPVKTQHASVQRQEHVDALRRRRKRRLAMAQAASTSSDVDVSDPDIDVWTLEAGRIASSVASLSLFLSSVRRAYLDLSSSSSSTAHSYGSKGKGTAGDRSKGELDLSKGVLEAWKDVRWLSDRERDEVDWQAKTTLKKCMSRVKQLEQAEKNRHTRAMQALSTLSANNISRLLGLPALQANEKVASEEVLHSHRQQVTLYLSRRLADVGHTQQEQQELRVHRQLEKQNMSSKPTIPQAGDKANSKGGKSSLEETVPSMYIPAPIASGSMANGYSDDEDDRPIDQMLSQAQIQQFESESSALLQEANSQLASIEKAQTSLLEISNLQSELAVHLTQQMEITDKLWEDSVLVSGRVEEGNKQLRQARDRNREGRLWLLIFMLGASFSLLFLEYY